MSSSAKTYRSRRSRLLPRNMVSPSPSPSRSPSRSLRTRLFRRNMVSPSPSRSPSRSPSPTPSFKHGNLPHPIRRPHSPTPLISHQIGREKPDSPLLPYHLYHVKPDSPLLPHQLCHGKPDSPLLPRESYYKKSNATLLKRELLCSKNKKTESPILRHNFRSNNSLSPRPREELVRDKDSSSPSGELPRKVNRTLSIHSIYSRCPSYVRNSPVRRRRCRSISSSEGEYTPLSRNSPVQSRGGSISSSDSEYTSFSSDDDDQRKVKQMRVDSEIKHKKKRKTIIHVRNESGSTVNVHLYS